MKMKKYIAMATVAMSFVACTHDNVPEIPGVEDLTDQPIVVHAGVDASTRGGTTSSNLSALGVTIVNPASAEYSYTNVEYIKSNDSPSFHTTEGVPTPLWQNATQEVTVTAYSPYRADWAGDQPFAVQTDQSTAEASQASDWLWVQDAVTPADPNQTGSILFRDRALHIRLQHRLCKLVVNLRYGSEVEAGLSVESLKVLYLATRCTVNAETGAVGTADTPADIIAHHEADAPEGYTDSFEAIFPPQTTSFKLEILLDNGRDFVYYNPAFTFQPGVAYTLDLAVGKDKVVLDGEGITAHDWDLVVGGKLETDDKI